MTTSDPALDLTLEALLAGQAPADLLPFVRRWARSQPEGIGEQLAHRADRLQAAWPRWWRSVRRRVDRTLARPLGSTEEDRLMEELEDLAVRFTPMGLRKTIPTVAPDQVPLLLNHLMANPHWRSQPDHPNWRPVVRLLMEHGTRLDAIDDHGYTTLYNLAFNGGAVAMFRCLDSAAMVPVAATLSPRGDTAWHMLCSRNLKRAHRGTDMTGAQPGVDLTGTIRAMLAAGMDVGLCDQQGNTPLHAAVRGGSLDVIRLLLDHGASAVALNQRDESPLTAAATQVQQGLGGSAAIHRMLLQHHVHQEAQALRSVLDAPRVPTMHDDGPVVPENPGPTFVMNETSPTTPPQASPPRPARRRM